MHHQKSTTPQELFGVLAAGAVMLMVVHGLGRFIYTPLFPYLVDDGQFTAPEGAAVATWNYFGYLVGAMLAIRWHRVSHIRVLLPAFLAVHVITTLFVTQTDNLTAISASRWLNGVANGVIFVQAPALILEWLVLRNRASMSGLVYIGVGLGLLVSSGLVTGSADWLEGAGRWWPAALISIPLAVWGAYRLSRLELQDHQSGSDGKHGNNHTAHRPGQCPIVSGLRWRRAGLHPPHDFPASVGKAGTRSRPLVARRNLAHRCSMHHPGSLAMEQTRHKNGRHTCAETEFFDSVGRCVGRSALARHYRLGSVCRSGRRHLSWHGIANPAHRPRFASTSGASSLCCHGRTLRLYSDGWPLANQAMAGCRRHPGFRFWYWCRRTGLRINLRFLRSSPGCLAC